MAHLGLNFTYVAHPAAFAYNEERKPSDMTRVMTVLMITTGIHRLFTPDDFNEFFTRLAISFKHYGLTDSFFTNDMLFEYLLDNYPCMATVDDILPNIGVTFGDAVENTSFADWVEKFDKIQHSAIMISGMLGIGLFSKETEGNGPADAEINFNIEYNPIKLDITETDIRNANIVSQVILKEIPAGIFKTWKQKYPDAEETVRKELERKRSMLFDYEKLTPEAKQIIREHFSFFWDAEDYDENLVIKLTHLAYLWANGFVYYDENMGFDVDDFFPIDPGDFELEDGGYNLEETKDNFDLDSLFPVLKVNSNK